MKKNLKTAFSTRQYMLSKDFELYYYSDINMKNVQSHSHDYYEFYFFLGGAVAIVIDGASYPLSPGTVILIPPRVPHHLDVFDQAVPYERFIFWISEDYCSQLVQTSADYGYIFQNAVMRKSYVYSFEVLVFNQLQNKIFNFLEELHSERYGKNAHIALCVSDLMLSLNRTIYELEHPQKARENASLYQNLLLYIEAHIDEDLTLERLAEAFFVNKYHISHTFKEHMGISLHQYVLKKRLDLIRSALLSSNEIGETYLDYGFKDYSSFFRAFKKEYGISPKAYRERHLAREQS